MSASMAEGIAGVLAEHERWESNYTLGADYYCTGCHIAYSLAANGYGKLEDAWEAGRRAGYDAGSRWARTGEDKDTPNPYRRPE